MAARAMQPMRGQLDTFALEPAPRSGLSSTQAANARHPPGGACERRVNCWGGRTPAGWGGGGGRMTVTSVSADPEFTITQSQFIF